LVAGGGALAAGCGPVPADPAAGDLTSNKSALIAGAMNVSEGIPMSDAETETAAVAIGPVVATAYMVFWEPTADTRCRGLSQIGMSYLSGPNTTAPIWRQLDLPVPPEMGSLRMSPSITATDNGTSYAVTVSAVAFSTALWNSEIGATQNCVSLDLYNNWRGDQVCAMKVTIPKDGTAATAGAANCFASSPSNNYFDTALTTVGSTTYMAAWDAAAYSIDFFNLTTGTKLASPFPGMLVNPGPVFVKGSPADLIAFDDESQMFWLSTFYAGTWLTPVAMSPNPSHFSPVLPDGITGTREYAAVYVPNAHGPGTTTLYYLDGHKLVGWSRQSGGVPDIFNSFSSASNHYVFHPAAEVATVPNDPAPYPAYFPLLTYWESDTSTGRLSLNYMGVAGKVHTLQSDVQAPCPVKGTWGYHDEMAVQDNNMPIEGDNAAASTFWRFVTDSTDGTCPENPDQDEFDHPTSGLSSSTTPQHISAYSISLSTASQ
jgi:hypothetical protein